MDYVNSDAHQTFGGWDGGIVHIVIVLVLLVFAIIIGYSNFQNARAFQIESSTLLPPKEALDALQAQMAQDAWHLGYRDETSLVMNIDKHASLGATAAIGFFSVWLALLYLITSRRPIVVQINATDAASGSTLITKGSQSGKFLLYIGSQLRDLPRHR